MLRRLELLSALAVLGSSSVAIARPIDDAADPALATAIVHDFTGIADVTPTSAAFVHGETLVTVEVAGSPIGDLITCNDPTDCQLVAYMGAPVTITFDPPIAAVGLQLFYSVGPFSVEVTGANGSELLTDATLGWQHPEMAFAGAADIGPISTVVLQAFDYSTYWEDLYIVEGGGAGTGVDLSLRSSDSDASVGAASPFTVGFRAHDHGPGEAAACEVVALPPAGTTVMSTTPSADVTATHATFDLGAIAADADVDVALELGAPARGAFSCDDSLRTIAVVHTGSGDAEPRNNIAVVDTAFARASAAEQEDCTTPVDDDCDGLFNCLDDDCIGGSSCPILLPDVAQSPFPPVIPWIDVPEDPLEELAMWSDPWNIPAPPQECRIPDNHGGTVRRPPMCCGPQPSVGAEHPSLFDWLSTCPPLDPNYKSAVPATNGIGYGTTAAGETIEYTITYENIGGRDAHDVGILDVLSPELDDTTLTIADGGEYDPATRTLSWIDPVLPPHEPHTVHYAIAVRDDAPVGTRVRNVATVVFPDAVPPSRMDTMPITHTIPVPGRDARADLRIASCEPRGDGSWTIAVVNADFGFAWDAHARIVDAPEGFVIDDGECAFAHPEDPHPEDIAVVLPWSTTPAIDEVRFTAPAGVDDPCAALTWEIVYYTADGTEIRGESKLEPAAPDGSDSSSDDESGGGDGSGGATENDDDGCSCRTSAPVGRSGWWSILLVALVRRRRA